MNNKYWSNKDISLKINKMKVDKNKPFIENDATKLSELKQQVQF